MDKKKPYGLKAGNGSKSLLEVNTLNLRVSLCNKPCLILHNFSILIGFVPKHPLSAYDIGVSRSRNKSPNLISLKLV